MECWWKERVRRLHFTLFLTHTGGVEEEKCRYLTLAPSHSFSSSSYPLTSSQSSTSSSSPGCCETTVSSSAAAPVSSTHVNSKPALNHLQNSAVNCIDAKDYNNTETDQIDECNSTAIVKCDTKNPSADTIDDEGVPTDVSHLKIACKSAKDDVDDVSPEYNCNTSASPHQSGNENSDIVATSRSDTLAEKADGLFTINDNEQDEKMDIVDSIDNVADTSMETDRNIDNITGTDLKANHSEIKDSVTECSLSKVSNSPTAISVSRLPNPLSGNSVCKTAENDITDVALTLEKCSESNSYDVDCDANQTTCMRRTDQNDDLIKLIKTSAASVSTDNSNVAGHLNVTSNASFPLNTISVSSNNTAISSTVTSNDTSVFPNNKSATSKSNSVNNNISDIAKSLCASLPDVSVNHVNVNGTGSTTSSNVNGLSKRHSDVSLKTNTILSNKCTVATGNTPDPSFVKAKSKYPSFSKPGKTADHVVNIIPKKSDSNTSNLIAEALKKLSSSSNSLTIVNISTNQVANDKTHKVHSKPNPEPKSRVDVAPVCKVEIEDEVLDSKDFGFEAEVMPCKTPRATNSLDSKELFAGLVNNCTGKAHNEASSLDIKHTAAMMMMLNSNNTTVTPAPVYPPTNPPIASLKRSRVADASSPSAPHFPLTSQDPSTGSGPNTSNSTAPGNGPLNNISLPSLLAPLGPHAPSFLLSPHSWHQQFRCMSPNMLMAIEAVRAGKMGFTQAGRTFGVNGRTLWVYYRRLGYKVHNTFRGRRSKDSTAVNNLMNPLSGLPQPLANHPLNSNNLNHNRLPANFNSNSSLFFPNNNAATNNNYSAFGNSAPNLVGRGVPPSNLKLPVEGQSAAAFHNFQSKFFENAVTSETGTTGGNLTAECGNNQSGNTPGNSSMAQCLVGTNETTGFSAASHEASNDDTNREVPSPSSLIGPMFGSSGSAFTGEDGSSYVPHDLNANMNCSQQQANFSQATGFGPMFFSNGGNFPTGFGDPTATGLLSGPSIGGGGVKQELGDCGGGVDRPLGDGGTREVEEANSTLEALLEACTNRGNWQHAPI